MRRLWSLGIGMALCGALIMAPASPARAQKKKPVAAKAEKGAKAKGAKGAPPAAAAPGEKEPEARIERTAGGGKVIKLSPIVVEGKVQKPLALVLARSSIPYEWEQLKQDFTPRIVEAVSKSPF
jgi:hypothetical protein